MDVDLKRFIHEVKKRPVLWNLNADTYFEDKHKRQAAWEEVAEAVFDWYNQEMEPIRYRTIRILMRKWSRLKVKYQARVKRILAMDKSVESDPLDIYQQLSFLKNRFILPPTINSRETPLVTDFPEAVHSIQDTGEGEEKLSISFIPDAPSAELKTPTPEPTGTSPKRRADVQETPLILSTSDAPSTGLQTPNPGLTRKSPKRRADVQETPFILSTSDAPSTGLQTRTPGLTRTSLKRRADVQETAFILSTSDAPSTGLQTPTPGPSKTAPKRRAEEETSLLNYINSSNSLNPPDEDRAFFDSLLPSIKTFTEDQKYDFRLEVMHLIRTMKRRNSHNTSFLNPTYHSSGEIIQHQYNLPHVSATTVPESIFSSQIIYRHGRGIQNASLRPHSSTNKYLKEPEAQNASLRPYISTYEYRHGQETQNASLRPYCPTYEYGEGRGAQSASLRPYSSTNKYLKEPEAQNASLRPHCPTYEYGEGRGAQNASLRPYSSTNKYLKEPEAQNASLRPHISTYEYRHGQETQNASLRLHCPMYEYGEGRGAQNASLQAYFPTYDYIQGRETQNAALPTLPPSENRKDKRLS